jgi:RNA polymerase primary sigma factor
MTVMSAQQRLLDSPKSPGRRHAAGVVLDVLPSRNRGPRPGFDPDYNENRAHRILDAKNEYVYDQSFDDPGAETIILAPMPGGARWTTAAGWLPGTQPRSVVRSHGSAPVFDAEQEISLFRRMNYLKCRAGRLRATLDPAHVRQSELDELERLQGEALAVKNQIIRAYLRLVVSIAKKQSDPSRNLFELVSDGNLGLIRAVEKFDFGRGFRFSTYATKAITRQFARSIPQERRRHHRFVTGFEKLLKAAVDHRAEETTCESDPRMNWRAVAGLLGRLSDRERQVLVSRYGLGGARVQTLAQLGAELGITRQRVLQIESRALETLRTHLESTQSE